jgi:RNA polymerase sigma-70 factor (ECF subfamily)
MIVEKQFSTNSNGPCVAQAERLLTHHRPALCAYILACVRSHADTEDIFQDVSIAVLQSIGDLRAEEEFLCWAREIARRRILAHFRRRGREQACDPEVVRQLSDALDRMERAGPASEFQQALTACLETLPPDNRQLIVLRYQDAGGEAEKLAAQFGRSVQGIYALVKRIKLALRDCVERRLAQEREP